MSTTKMVDGGGRVLSTVNVVLIYWGRAWSTAAAHPTEAEVTGAIRSILGGPFMSELAQYRGITNGSLHSTTTAPTDPPHVFTNDDLANLVKSCIAAGAVPHPRELANPYYHAIVQPNFSDGVDGLGRHWPIDVDGHKVAIGWSGNAGMLQNVTTAFCHELVEACTDPDTDGFRVKWTDGTLKEIADVCAGPPPSLVHGVPVISYWSQRLNACVAPTGPDVVELWRGSWTTGWTQFAPFELGGQSYYVAYKAGDGYTAIDKVRPDGTGVDTQWTTGLPKGYTSLIHLQLQGVPYVLAHDQASHQTAIHRVHLDGKGMDKQWAGQWGHGYQAFAPFRIGGDAYYLAYNGADGGMAIDRLNPLGVNVTTTYQARWTLGWTHIVPFTAGGKVHYLAYKAGDGLVALDRIHPDGGGVDTLWTGGIPRGCTSIDPFTLGTVTYFLAYNSSTGRTCIYRRRPEDGALELAWRGSWTPGWTSFVPFQLGGQSCHLAYKLGDGTAAIDRYIA